MSKTFKHQDQFDYVNSNKTLHGDRLMKLLRYFHRVNFWDWDLKIAWRRHKDFVRGGQARIKTKKYK